MRRLTLITTSARADTVKAEAEAVLGFAVALECSLNATGNPQSPITHKAMDLLIPNDKFDQLFSQLGSIPGTHVYEGDPKVEDESKRARGRFQERNLKPLDPLYAR